MKHSNDIATDALLAHWTSEGKVVEGGWEQFARRNLSADAPQEQITEMRKAWMLGAQHVVAILLHLADSDQKVKVLTAMTTELKEFQRFYLRGQEVSNEDRRD